jgi:hypothetical protein
LPSTQSQSRACRGKEASETVKLDHMVKHGLLTAEEAREVVDVVSLLAKLVVMGDISPHCLDVVIDQLAREKCDAWRARNRGQAPK